MTLTQKFKRLHYAWIILFAACILGIVSRADSASFSVFIDPLVERFCWSHGDISLAYAIAFIAGMPAVMIMGWLGDRFGARFLMIGASFLISAGTLLMGRISELWQFYVLYGLFVGSMGHAAFTAAVNTSQFEHRVRQAALLTNEESKGIRLTFKGQELTLASRAPESGEAEVTCPIQYDGDEVSIGFNPGFLVDALKVIDAEEIHLGMNASNKPAVLKAGNDFLYVLMPVDLG